MVVRVAPAGGQIRFEVADRGAGIPADVLARVGEPFFTTKPAGKGMGLGVFLARAVADRLGGEVTITSAPGTGATGIETFIGSGRRHASTGRLERRASATYRPLTPRASASSRMRSARGSTGRCTGWPKPGALLSAGVDGGGKVVGDHGLLAPAATWLCAPASSRAHSSAVPRITGPQPRMPAATAPCSDPGSAASVIRAATLVGIIPCSAMATSSRSRKNRCCSVGSSPVSSRWKYSVKPSRPSGRRSGRDRVPRRGRGTPGRCG